MRILRTSEEYAKYVQRQVTESTCPECSRRTYMFCTQSRGFLGRKKVKIFTCFCGCKWEVK